MGKILHYVLSLVKTVMVGAAIEGDSIVVRVRPHRREQLRCPVCGRRCSCHNHVPARRCRAMELASSRCYLK
jgi:transposase